MKSTVRYSKVPETGGMRRMKKYLMEIVAKGERYIICSSSLFLMTLAVYVHNSSLLMADSKLCEKVLRHNISVLGGKKIFGYGCTNRHRKAAVADLNGHVKETWWNRP